MGTPVVPTPETLSRIDRGGTFFEWILPRLAGDDAERETTLVMVMAQMGERYAEGLHDAADILRRMANAKPASKDLAVAADALEELERRHRAAPVTSI